MLQAIFEIKIQYIAFGSNIIEIELFSTFDPRKLSCWFMFVCKNQQKRNEFHVASNSKQMWYRCVFLVLLFFSLYINFCGALLYFIRIYFRSIDASTFYFVSHKIWFAFAAIIVNAELLPNCVTDDTNWMCPLRIKENKINWYLKLVRR